MKVEKKLTFAELTGLNAAELFSYAKDTVKMTKAVATAKDKFTENLKFSAKVVAAMKRRYTAQVETKGIPADTSFKKYFEQNAGGTCPPRVEALASLFNALVETNLLKEEHFDGAAVDWLEKANAIVSAARKAHGEQWKECADVTETVSALSTPGDALKALKDIRKRQKDAVTPAAGTAPETAPVLTVGMAKAFIIAAFRQAHEFTRERQAELCGVLFEINDAWSNNDLTENRRAELDQQIAENDGLGVPPALEIKRQQSVAAEKAELLAA